ncbi:MAG: transglutaminase-like cysteine peptidase [Alphaproteobacteria bacterium]|nr:transglutaminase-like cysteine peptidase [Alphaproteobacteria bacterium]
MRLSVLVRSGILAIGFMSLAACSGVTPHGGDLAAAVTAPASSLPSNVFTVDQWSTVTARFAQEQSEPMALCASGSDAAQCPAARWASLVAELSQLPLRDRVERVNAAFNALPYIPAAQNWGDPMYWETPYELLAKGGQCEDYAIAKFLALAQSGVPESALHFIVVHDSVSQLDHAITLVTVDGEDLVLDNQVDDVLPAASVSRYTPYYSLNDGGIQVFARPADRMAAQLALRPDGGFTVARY